MLKKALLLLSAALAFLSAASGCLAHSAISDEDNADFVAASIYDPVDKNRHDLSADGAIQVSYSINGGEEVILRQAVGTNSTKITAANNSGAAVEVYLYYDGKPDSPIQQFTLNNKETKSFTNLTSRFAYSLGIAADIDTQLDLTITD